MKRSLILKRHASKKTTRVFYRVHRLNGKGEKTGEFTAREADPIEAEAVLCGGPANVCVIEVDIEGVVIPHKTPPPPQWAWDFMASQRIMVMGGTDADAG